MDKLTVLCVPNSGLGHVNAILGIATALHKRGHRMVIAAEKSYKGNFEKLGFEEHLYNERDENACEASTMNWAEMMNATAEALKLTPEKQPKAMAPMLHAYFAVLEFTYDSITKIIENVKPDVIIEDFACVHPALLTKTIPLVRLYSANPLNAWDDESLPPAMSGLPLNDKKDWDDFRLIQKETKHEYNEIIYNILKSKNKISVEFTPNMKFWSKNLNVYVYPQALVKDYLEKISLDNTWIGIDHSLRDPTGKFDVPETLKSKPGRLIYFSLGSLGSSIIELMNRLIKILSKSPHKFIVAKGHMHEKIELTENMWGEAFLPQLDLLPHVDLVLTHGGNNTFIETLYFGKPMIVLPLFADQHDNAQRAVEMNIGLKFTPFFVEENELREGIEKVLYDEKIVENVKRISKEMQESKSMELAIDKIEFVAKNHCNC